MNSINPEPVPPSGKAPFRPIVYAEPKAIREDRPDGSILLRCEHALDALPAQVWRRCSGARSNAGRTGCSLPNAMHPAPGPG